MVSRKTRGLRALFPEEREIVKALVIDKYGMQCRYCHKKLNNLTLTMDHKIPVSEGGTNDPNNLVPSCSKCNSKRGITPYEEYLHRRGLELYDELFNEAGWYQGPIIGQGIYNR